MKTIVLDKKMLANPEQVHGYLKKMLELPEYYGENLDALYDCLTELSEVEILIQTGQTETEFASQETQPEEGYLGKVLSVFEDAAEENDGIKLKIE